MTLLEKIVDLKRRLALAEEKLSKLEKSSK